jgi:uncharacterized protein (DUF1330 family)
MTAYVIFIRDSIKDAEAMAEYSRLAVGARADHKMTPLAFYGPLETLEGPKADGVVIIGFPSMEEARAWYDSPAYQEALPHRLRGAEYRVILAQGL